MTFETVGPIKRLRLNHSVPTSTALVEYHDISTASKVTRHELNFPFLVNVLKAIAKLNGLRVEHGSSRLIVEYHRPKQVCKYFLTGKCTKGDDCPFRHDNKPIPQNKRFR